MKMMKEKSTTYPGNRKSEEGRFEKNTFILIKHPKERFLLLFNSIMHYLLIYKKRKLIF